MIGAVKSVKLVPIQVGGKKIEVLLGDPCSEKPNIFKKNTAQEEAPLKNIKKKASSRKGVTQKTQKVTTLVEILTKMEIQTNLNIGDSAAVNKYK